MFAIIDIETCGGKFDFHRGRIIEISILIHDGLTVVDKFTTLINPECNITSFFTKLSGITNEMVANAPKFFEVAKKINEITEDKIFVAHNVGFDYTFVKEEFSSLGFKYRRDTLCTVRLSRKLIPGKMSYSLGNLCAMMGIENEARHRAEGDAVATAKLFDRLMQLKNTNPQFKNVGLESLMTRKVDKIKEYILKKLPETCGVYYFLDKDGNIIYIGKSTNMYNRAMSHFNTKEQKGKKMLNELMNVDFVQTGSELIALLMESEEIKKHKPKYNRMRKSDAFTHCIDWRKENDGIIRFAIVPYEESENTLLSFNSYLSARERLENWIEEHDLCLRYCGLTDEESVCFNHQIKKCKGICAGDEQVTEYNLRATKMLEKYIFEHEDFVLLDRGREPEERSVILVEKGMYKGYGYFNASDSVGSHDALRDFISHKNYFPDTKDIILGWMRQKESLRKHLYPLGAETKMQDYE